MTERTTERLLSEVVEQTRNRYYGKYRGFVADIEDPEEIGRIRARIPSILGLERLTPWAYPCLPYAGEGVGQFMIPPEGAGVWIEFEGGDLSRPLWTGGWWAKEHVPKNEAGTKASTTLKVLRSDEGLMVTFDDSGKVITVSDGNGSNILTIDASGGEIKVKATSKVVVEAPQIELVEGATHPVVFGDNLLQYLNQLVNLFNNHVHPGETTLGIPVSVAKPLAIFPPATSTLLSRKVKSG